MEFVILLAILIPLAILGAFAALFAITAALRRRLAQAEARLGWLEARLSALPEAPGGEAPGAEPEPAPEPEPARAAATPPPLPVFAAPVFAPELAPAPPQAPGFIATVTAWLQENWFYAIAALSLALAGLFAAQYAAERGMLSPAARLVLAAGFGAALIAAGEAIRRRWGDGAETATAYLPAVFSGAGIVTLYGAALSAQMLYGLISPGLTLVLLVAIAAGAVVLGWFSGPLLAVIGLLGATAAPFLAGGEAGPAALIQGYFGLVMVSGLLVNGLKKWRWINEISLALPYAAAVLAYLGAGGDLAFLALSALMPVGATILLAGSVRPALPGPALIVRLALRGGGPIPLPRALPVLVWGAGALGIVAAASGFGAPQALGVVALTGLFALGAVWSRSAPGASDFPLIAALALFALSLGIGPVGFRLPEGTLQAGRLAFYLLLGAAALLSLIAAQRSAEEAGPAALWWAQGAAFVGPGLLVLQEVLHAPGHVIGAFPWAAVGIGFAAGATLLAGRAQRRDGADRSRVSLAALAALTFVALALFILLSAAALNVALGVLVLAAVMMDDRWRLRHLAGFAQIGVAVLVYRVAVSPGLIWAFERAGYPDLVLAHAAPAAALAAAWALLREADRPVTSAAAEGGFAVVLGAGLSVVLARGLRDLSGPGAFMIEHLQAGLIGTVWLISGWASLRTAQADVTASPGRQAARWVRRVTAGLSFLTAAAALGAACTLANPLLNPSERVLGPVIVSSLALAYLLPGLVTLAMAVRLRSLSKLLRGVIGAAGAVLAALYLFLTVAQAWRGNALAGAPMGDGELWSYTALLLAIGGGLLLAALILRATWLRYLADAVLGVAIAKVFLLDAADLDGLARAGSFLILGLALAGLAWINRRAALAAKGAGG